MKLDAEGRISLEFARFDDMSAAELHDVLKLRFDVFVLEQESLYPEIDGLDPEAVHGVASDGEGRTVATLRLLNLGGAGAVTIGRVAIAEDARGYGLGRRLMSATLGYLEAHAPRRSVRLGAQRQLEGFYASLGFARTSDVYDDGGIPHVDMERPGR
ncbi:MAG: GNAT family N-acetyltransferase [Pseudomonadota bacterium]